jgi:hypothetical protein
VILDGLTGYGIDGNFRAPYLIPPGTPPVRVVATITGPGIKLTTPEEQIELAPSAVPGAADCLGPGQTFTALPPGLQYVFLDQLPTVLHRVEPEYPRSAFVRGITDTVIIGAILCRNGRVLDAYAVHAIRDTGEPVENDPKLVAAAIDAVRQWIFQPGMSHGQAVACTMMVPVAFRH